MVPEKGVQAHECPSPNCIETFPCPITLKVHFQDVHELPNVKQLANATFTNTNTNTNSDTNINPKHNQLLSISYTCHICENENASFSTRELLSQHSIIHLKGHKCHSSQCHLAYGSLGHNSTELKSNGKHTGTGGSNIFPSNPSNISTPEVEICNEVVDKSSTLLAIDKSDTSLEPVKHPQTSLAQKTLTNIDTTNIIHRGRNYQYQCKICHKSLPSKTTFIEHNKLHKGLPYTCPICDRSYALKNTFRQHLATHNREGSEGNSISKQRGESFRCKICGLKFKGKEYLKGHYLSAHNNGNNGQRVYMCEICGEIFPDEQFCLIHAQSHFSGEVIRKAFFNCRICGRKFPGKDMYDKHSCRFAADSNST